MPRVDGRSVSALRPLHISIESLDRVDSSASFVLGQIKALASVSGPIQVRLAAESPSKATFEVLVRPLSGISGTESKALATTLRTLLAPSLVLTQNPRTLIQLVVQSLTPALPTHNPSLTAAFINASSIALLRASSFSMLGVVCAAAVGRTRQQHDISNRDDLLLLDPSEEELQQCDATGCVAILFKRPRRQDTGDLNEDMVDYEGEIVWSFFQGAPLQSDYDALLRLARTGAMAVYKAIQNQLREKIQGYDSRASKQSVRKMPKHRGGRVSIGTEARDAMEIT